MAPDESWRNSPFPASRSVMIPRTLVRWLGVRPDWNVATVLMGITGWLKGSESAATVVLMASNLGTYKVIPVTWFRALRSEPQTPVSYTREPMRPAGGLLVL